jgi:hypothetical protein
MRNKLKRATQNAKKEYLKNMFDEIIYRILYDAKI